MSLELLEDIAPEFFPGDGSTDDRCARFLERAAARLHAPAFGSMYAEAAAYLAAHLLTVSERRRRDGAAAPGALVSLATGDQSRSWSTQGGAPGDRDAGLRTTAYGEQFLEIRNSRAATSARLYKVGR